MKYVWLSQLIILLVLLSQACGPESLQPTNDLECRPNRWKVASSQGLYQKTLAPGQPGAIGCFRVVWGPSQDAQSYQVKLLPDGKILPKVKETGLYEERPITLPNEARDQSPYFTLFVYGTRFQAGGSATPEQTSALCLEMQNPNFNCNAKPGETCWVSMNVPNTKSAEGQKPASCQVSFNPDTSNEPTGPEQQPELTPEPPAPTEPPPLPDQSPTDSSMEPIAPEPPPTEPPPLPDQAPPDATEPVGPELPIELPPMDAGNPEAVTDLLPDTPLVDTGSTEAGTGEVEPGCTPGTTQACSPDFSKFGVCQQREQICLATGVWSTCQPVKHANPPPEICDAEDNNCDGQIDESNICKLPTPCSPAPCIYTLAGPAPGTTNAGKFGKTNGAADQAAFNQPRGIAIDPQGNIYISETGNHLIRIIYPNGQVGTYAGGGTVSNQKTVRLQAAFNTPHDIAFGPGGDLYVSDRGNGRLRYIDSAGSVHIRTITGLTKPSELAFEPSTQTLFIADNGQTSKKLFHLKAGTAAFYKDTFTDVTSLLVIDKTQLLFTEAFENCLQEFSPTTLMRVTLPYAGTCNAPGFQDASRQKALFDNPTDMAKDSQGNLYIYDEQYRRIRKIDTNGNVTTIVNQSGTNPTGFQDGPAETARFHGKIRIAIDGQDNLLIADMGNHAIRKLVLK